MSRKTRQVGLESRPNCSVTGTVFAGEQDQGVTGTAPPRAGPGQCLGSALQLEEAEES